jgi:hypothetical protein
LESRYTIELKSRDPIELESKNPIELESNSCSDHESEEPNASKQASLIYSFYIVFTTKILIFY